MPTIFTVKEVHARETRLQMDVAFPLWHGTPSTSHVYAIDGISCRVQYG